MPKTPEKMDIICVACPKGCQLETRRSGGEILVSNEGCKRGQEYAVNEIHDPRRMVASTVRVQGGLHPLMPVHTALPFPKGQIKALLAALRGVELQAPVRVRQVVLSDSLGSGIDILASRDMPEK
jgi:CxxC motif-containing protein